MCCAVMESRNQRDGSLGSVGQRLIISLIVVSPPVIRSGSWGLFFWLQGAGADGNRTWRRGNDRHRRHRHCVPGLAIATEEMVCRWRDKGCIISLVPPAAPVA